MAQVFVDDSGRRRRWARLAGAGVTALCAAYMGIVVVGLSQTAVGPLIAVPSDGNGRVAGFPDTSGIVPGLLATGGAAARPAHHIPAPVVRERAVTEAAGARSARPKASPEPARAPASPAGAGRGRATLTPAAA